MSERRFKERRNAGFGRNRGKRGMRRRANTGVGKKALLGKTRYIPSLPKRIPNHPISHGQ
jgi:hypothetical protein